MVINYEPKNKNFIDKEVRVGFAFLPTHDFITGEYFWLERYYVYDDSRFLYKSRKSLYKSKSEFFTVLKT